MDPVNGIYYMVGTNISSRVIALVGISCTTGLVVSETPLPFLLEVFVGIGQFAAYDSKMDEVLVVGRDPDVKNQHVILRVKPQTGRVRMVAKVGDFSMLELLGGVRYHIGEMKQKRNGKRKYFLREEEDLEE